MAGSNKTRRLKRARPRSPRKSPARDDTLEPHGASVPEHRLAVVALKALREADRRAGFFQRLVQHPAAPDQLDAAQVLRFEPDTIEGVQTGARLTVAAEEPVEAGQTVETVRDRFAVEHDAGGGEGAHDIRDGDEVTRPVAAQKRSLQHLRE